MHDQSSAFKSWTLTSLSIRNRLMKWEELFWWKSHSFSPQTMLRDSPLERCDVDQHETLLNHQREDKHIEFFDE